MTGRSGERESAVAECLDVCWIYQWSDVVLVHNLNLVILVRSAEAIEEVNEWNPSLQSSEVRNGCKVHNLLNRTRAEHCETCLTASHHVHVVTEDTERV